MDNLKELQAHWPSLRDAESVEPKAASSVSDGQPDAPRADGPAPELLENFDAPYANGATPPRIDPAEMTPKPEISFADAQRLLAESQVRCAQATERQLVARSKVATALAAFQKATMQTMTFEQLARQHIESENQLRADRAAGKIAPRGGQRRLGSAVDSFAYHTRATGRSAGGGRAFSRKAYPASMRGRVISKE